MAALMGAGAFGVHQLRYALTYDGPQAAHGHGYLVPVGAVLTGVLLLAFASALGRIARRTAESVPRFRRLWAGASLSLLLVYCAQESIEAVVTGGMPGLPGQGGWVALPLALAVGLAIALIMRGTAAATSALADRRPWRAPVRIAAIQTLLPPWAPAKTRGSAVHLAPRGPPVASV
ncbi:MAG: hypothetical protein QOF55_2168 [Thermoleophilaceae bacterium]|jgi:hypothetical protein|nr:hypothetical protein [Thermoleophilaceae bacterium]